MGQFAAAAKDQQAATPCKVGVKIEDFDEDDRKEFVILARQRKLAVIGRLIDCSDHTLRRHFQAQCRCPVGSTGKGAYLEGLT